MIFVRIINNKLNDDNKKSNINIIAVTIKYG